MNPEIIDSYIKWLEKQQELFDPAEVFAVALTISLSELYYFIDRTDADVFLGDILAALDEELSQRKYLH